MQRCSHCLGEVKEGQEIKDNIGGKSVVFCCQSCLQVYRILHETGLQEFYSKRTGWKEGPPEQIEIDPSVFKEFVKTTNNEAQLSITISGIRCASCIWLIEHFLKKDPAIIDIKINYATHRATIRWKPSETTLERVLHKIVSIGYTPRPAVYSEYQASLEAEKKDLLIRFGTSAFFSMQLMLYSVALYAGYFQGIEPIYRRVFQFIAWGLATPVLFYGGYPFIKNSLRGIKQRSINMDILILLGASSAYLYSIFMIFAGKEVFFDTSAMIITLILLGRFLEVSARRKAGEAMEKLIQLQPKDARVIDEKGNTLLKPVSSIKVNQRIEVHPGEKIPLDGKVVSGDSEVDESMLTGESTPSYKTKGSEVFSGTLNLNGKLIIEVTKSLKDSVLTQIIETVQSAQESTAPIQRVADRVVGWFVPAILSIAFMTLFYWFLKTGSLNIALMNSVSVLVIACPCALGLATPLAVMIGSLRASTKGILIKGGDIIEQTAKTEIVFLDKTGTITEGRPSVTDIKTLTDRHILLQYACTAERASGHTIGNAIASLCDNTSLELESIEVLPGKGLVARVCGRSVLIGNLKLMEEYKITIEPEIIGFYEYLLDDGKTVVFVSIDNKLSGVFGLIDNLKADAAKTVKELKKLGLKAVMLTGDNNKVATYIANQAGIEEVHAELNPIEKAQLISMVKKTGKKTMMVGDGINDAPSLTEADVGVAVGRATDIALESSDVVIMKKQLNALSELLLLSRKTMRIIKENLFWAFSYNFIAIPLAVTGTLHPIVAALSMAISSLVVVSNSLRLLRY